MGRRLEQAGFRVLLAGSVAEGTHVADGLDGPLDLHSRSEVRRQIEPGGWRPAE
jgi:hypothetical protein